MKTFFPILLLAYVAYLVFTTSCANPGMPTGGPKDSIPPVVVHTVPEIDGRNYEGKTVSLTFNEFVIADAVREALVVSPPLKRRPVIRTKSRTLIIDLGEDLKENTTYSLDFKDAIVDNNEKNPLEDFRFSFSTGPDFDSLMIGGYVKNAKDLEPVEGALVLLHSLQDLSAFTDSIPDYIATTDEKGFYVISNIAEGSYRLYALTDADNSLNYNQEAEQIAFYDSLVVPLDLNLPTYQLNTVPEYTVIPGNTIAGDTIPADTLSLKDERRHALDEPFFLMMFEEEFFDQYLDNYKRAQANLINFGFAESLSDSFKVKLLKPSTPSNDWNYTEFNPERDSVNIWITDTLISYKDTLITELSYLVTDTLDNFVLKKDTLELLFAKPEEPKRRRKKDDDEPGKIPHITFKHNLKSRDFDVYEDIVLEAPEPLASFDLSMIRLFQTVDTLEQQLDFELVQDSMTQRKFFIKYPWEFEEQYRFHIDSAAGKNYFGHPNNEMDQKFVIQKEGYYAKIILLIENLKGPGIVQLLKNTDKEEVLQQIRIQADSEIEFPYLKPEKYKIRLILDANNNGKWDTGNIDKGIQPERVMYFSKILKLRSNFEVRESWALPDGLQYEKELIDEDKPEVDSNRRQTNVGR